MRRPRQESSPGRTLPRARTHCSHAAACRAASPRTPGYPGGPQGTATLPSRGQCPPPPRTPALTPSQLWLRLLPRAPECAQGCPRTAACPPPAPIGQQGPLEQAWGSAHRHCVRNGLRRMGSNPRACTGQRPRDSSDAVQGIVSQAPDQKEALPSTRQDTIPAEEPEADLSQTPQSHHRALRQGPSKAEGRNPGAPRLVPLRTGGRGRAAGRFCGPFKVPKRPFHTSRQQRKRPENTFPGGSKKSQSTSSSF